VEEIIADVDEAAGEIVLLIHWTGGRHSELPDQEESHSAAQSLYRSGDD
jgi:hypothetical protein